MRDIRQDLKERLGILEARRSELHSELKEMDEESATVIRLLDIEDRRFPPEQLGQTEPEPTVALAEFIFTELGKRPLGKDEMRPVAERGGYFKDTESPGRVLHLTLVNMERANRIRVREDGKYEQARREPANGLFVPEFMQRG
jgi:hypothetical protein